MVEEMILRLRTSQRLHVIALSSVLAYDASADDPVRAGRALGVDYVLSGRVAANPDAVRLALRLQDTGSGFDIWSSQAEVLPTELITRLPAFASAIGHRLDNGLSRVEAENLKRPFTNSAKAWARYARGRADMLQPGRSAFQRTEEDLRAATVLDPRFWLAFTRLAELHAEAADRAFHDPDERALEVELARGFALRALRLNEKLSEAHTVLARLSRESALDLSGAEGEARRAARCGPHDPAALHELALALAARGRLGNAVRLLKAAWALDPLSAEYPSHLSWVHLLMGEVDRALAYGQLAKEMRPRFADCYWHLGMAYLAKGMPIIAIDRFNCYEDHGGDVEIARGAIALAQRRAGRAEVANGFLYRLGVGYHEGAGGAYAQALARLDTEDDNVIMDWLERAHEEHSDCLIYLGVDPLFESMRRNPRFRALLGKMGIR